MRKTSPLEMGAEKSIADGRTSRRSKAPEAPAAGSVGACAFFGAASPLGDRIVHLLEGLSLRACRLPIEQVRLGRAPEVYELVLIEPVAGGHTDFATCVQAAAAMRAPLILLSERDFGNDRTMALELGADDWWAGTATDRDILASARALLRRRGKRWREASGETVRRIGCWRLDTLTRRLTHDDGRIVSLTAVERDLILVLADAAGRTFSDVQLCAALGGEPGRRFSTQITRLRRKLGPGEAGGLMIRNIWGVGYFLDPHGARAG